MIEELVLGTRALILPIVPKGTKTRAQADQQEVKTDGLEPLQNPGGGDKGLLTASQGRWGGVRD